MKGDHMLEAIITTLLVFAQVVMSFVFQFDNTIPIVAKLYITNSAFIAMYSLQIFRLFRSNVLNKWRFYAMVHLNFLTLYIKGALVLYAYVLGLKTEEIDNLSIFLNCLRFFFQIEVMLFYCTKEFTSLPSAIIAELTMIIWVSFLFQSSIETSLNKKT